MLPVGASPEPAIACESLSVTAAIQHMAIAAPTPTLQNTRCGNLVFVCMVQICQNMLGYAIASFEQRPEM